MTMTFMRTSILALCVPVVGGGIVGLAACSGQTKVTRTASGATEGGDLSGYWNDIDAELVAKTIISDLVSSRWVNDFQEENNGRRPVVKLAGVIKRTDDRNVNTQFFAKQVERFLLNSGRVRVVAASGQEDINVNERDRQAEHASDATAKSQRNELGSDFTLQTVINSQNESDGGGRRVRAYLVNMELVDTETQEKVWIGEEKIRKVIEQASARW
ncbi:MAG: penicillin-binding protein activator LpoB [Myxococcota bacterium]